nr:MAG TPA: hypothetical protein [Caudoviricetes sp.]
MVLVIKFDKISLIFYNINVERCLYELWKINQEKKN